MGKEVLIPRREDKTSAELKGIFAQLELAMSRGLGPFTRCSVVFAEHMEQVCDAKAQGLVRLAFFVDEQREFDLGVFAELAGVGCIAQTDRDKLGAFLFEGVLVLAQLRDVLTAEDSAIVAEKNDDRRIAGPQTA